VVLDELENGGCIRGLLEGLANVGVLEEFRDAGHGMQVLLELALRHEEKDHEVDRPAVERVESDAPGRAAEGGDGNPGRVGSSR
jgi:hypothetical protein